jgi:arsenate reductase-like glutaredoxin family protein
MALLKDVSKLTVAKGKKVTVVDLKKDALDDDGLAKLMLGPTGNLRAPTLRKGKSLYVGFNEDMFAEAFGK